MAALDGMVVNTCVFDYVI